MNYIAIVVGEILPQKSFDVFEDERLGHNLADSSNRLRKHVPLVIFAEMLPAKRERLAGRATSDELNLAFVGTIIVITYVAFNDLPRFDMINAISLVPPEGFACVMVAFQDNFVLKPCLCDAQSKSTRAREKFN